MALVTTSVTPDPDYYGFGGLPDTLKERSQVPRGEVIFNFVGSAIAVATGGDTQLLSITCNLPPNFAYVPVDMNLQVTGASAADWGGVGQAFLAEQNVGSSRKFLPRWELVSNGVMTSSVVNRTWCVNRNCVPKALFYAQPKIGAFVKCAIEVGNTTADGSAMTTDGFIRFLVYDVEQAHQFEVNNATLVR